MRSQQIIVNKLPEKLKKGSYFASGEYAWSKEGAVEIIDWLSNKVIVVNGIEIWIPTQPGPTIPSSYIYSWEAEQKKKDENWLQFVEHTNKNAKNYILSFQWDENDLNYKDCIPYFNLDICSELD